MYPSNKYVLKVVNLRLWPIMNETKRFKKLPDKSTVIGETKNGCLVNIYIVLSSSTWPKIITFSRLM